MNVHPAMKRDLRPDQIPDGLATVYTLKDEYAARCRHLQTVEDDHAVLAEIAEVARAKKDLMGSWAALSGAVRSMKWKEDIVGVPFQIREKQTGDYKVVGSPASWIVTLLESSSHLVVVAREANYTIPANSETGAAAVVVHQTALELYPRQPNADYHLGTCVAKLRIDEEGNLQFGPCGPYAQHGVPCKTEGDAAMRLFHFAATQ